MEGFKQTMQTEANGPATGNTPDKENAKPESGYAPTSHLDQDTSGLNATSLSLENKTSSHCGTGKEDQTRDGKPSPSGISGFSLNANAPQVAKSALNGEGHLDKDLASGQQEAIEQAPSNQLAPEHIAKNDGAQPVNQQASAAANNTFANQSDSAQLNNQLSNPIIPSMANAPESFSDFQKMPPIASVLGCTAEFQQNMAQENHGGQNGINGNAGNQLANSGAGVSAIDTTTNALAVGANAANPFDCENSPKAGFLPPIRKSLPFDSKTCFLCKMGSLIPNDVLISCADCKHPFHLKCAQLSKTPSRDDWYCMECQQERRENLLRKLKEDNRRKAEDRLRKKAEEQRMKDEAREVRETKLNARRDEKAQQKMMNQQLREEREAIRREERIAKEAAIAKARAEREAQGILNESLKNDAKKSVQTTLQLALNNGEMALNGEPLTEEQVAAIRALRQRSLEPKRKVKRVQVLSEAELEKIERSKLIKSQMQLFQRLYPELVEKNSIKYPIEDSLILKLPELHGLVYPEKPTPKPIMTSNEEFEQLLYIWEFCNNFDEFLEIQKFKIEDLRLALRWGSQDAFNEAEDQSTNFGIQKTVLDIESQKKAVFVADEANWNEQCTQKQIDELGFNMVNTLFQALVDCFMRDMFPEESEDKSKAAQQSSFLQNGGQDQAGSEMILSAIHRIVSEEEQEQLWPEIVRLLLLQRQSYEDFGEYNDVMEVILKKLSDLEPDSFNRAFKFDEKIVLLTVLIDTVHDLNEFRSFLTKRNELKSSYNKEKMDVYATIKELEAQQQDIVKEQTTPEFIQETEDLNRELAELQTQVAHASRTETKSIRYRINEIEGQLEAKKHYKNSIDDKINRKQILIARLTDKAYQTQIQTKMLGRDAQRQEYWHFKDDPSRIYIRREEKIPVRSAELQLPSMEQVNNIGNNEGSNSQESPGFDGIIANGDEPSGGVATKTHYSWFFYDNDIEVWNLTEKCLNIKGLRERQLQQALRGVRDRLKLKKAPVQAVVKPVEVEQAEEVKLEEKVEDAQEEDKAEKVAETGDNVEMTEDQPKESEKANSSPHEESKSEQKEDAEMSSEKEDDPQDLHIMFQTDKWEVSFTNVVWFGKKIPTKRRQFGRGIRRDADAGNDEVGADMVSLANCSKLLKSTENFYSESSTQFGSQWGEPAARLEWNKTLDQVQTCAELAVLLTNLDDGMCVPNFPGLPPHQQRFKIMHFKFWPSQELRRSWRDYLSSPLLEVKEGEAQVMEIDQENVVTQGSPHDGNRNALFILLKIVEQINEQFVIREVQKQEKKQKQEVMQAVSKADKIANAPIVPEVVNNPRKAGNKQTEQQRWTRPSRPAPGFAKYFESSDEEESQSEEDEQEEDQADEEVKVEEVAEASQDEQFEDEDVEVSNSEEESESGSEQSREWDEYCMICQDGGNVICCDGCSNVAHMRCLGVKKMREEEEWNCEACKTKKKTAPKKTVQAKLATNGKLIKGKSTATKEEKPARRGRPKLVKSPSPEPQPTRQMSRRAQRAAGISQSDVAMEESNLIKSRSQRQKNRQKYY